MQAQHQENPRQAPGWRPLGGEPGSSQPSPSARAGGGWPSAQATLAVGQGPPDRPGPEQEIPLSVWKNLWPGWIQRDSGLGTHPALEGVLFFSTFSSPSNSHQGLSGVLRSPWQPH